MIVLLWLFWAVMMFALTQLSLFGAVGLAAYIIFGLATGLWLHKITEDYRDHHS